MLKVFITVDTEILDTSTRYLECIQSDIYGITPSGEFGLNYQIDMLNKYGLKAVFFVDSLFAYAVGIEPIRNIVKTIQDGGHEVQLHIHTEWLKKTHNTTFLKGRDGNNIKEFSEHEQQFLIAQGLDNLQSCGVENVCAFRAGNYGADLTTLCALARNGIIYDTSYNIDFLATTCDIKTENLLLQPKKIHGIYEIPISFFEDMPNHYRPVQLCACSSREIENALLDAWKLGWFSFVVVLHTFELVKMKGSSQKTRNLTKPNPIVIRRFEKLCSFLAENRDKFITTKFSDLDPGNIPDVSTLIIKSNLFLTAHRIIEQLIKTRL
jgi:hypothetical protein